MNDTTRSRPPWLATWVLRMVSPPALRHEMLDALAETFSQYCETRGKGFARRWYWRQVLHLDYLRLRFSRRSLGQPVRKSPVRDRRPLSGLGLDLRYILRSLRREPVFLLTAVLTLALGIAATTAVFSLVNAVLLSPLPYATPQRLALLWHQLERVGVERALIASADVRDFREQATSFEGLALANNLARASLGVSDRAYLVSHARVTPNLFFLLGVRPAIGRLSAAENVADIAASSTNVPLVISHAMWRRAFGSDPDIIGQLVSLNGAPATVIGITRPEFELAVPPDAGFPRVVDVWTPTPLNLGRGVRDDQRVRDQDSDDTGVVIARLRDGVSFADAQAEMDRVSSIQRATHRWHEAVGARVVVAPMHADVVQSSRHAMWVLSAAVIAVLLIACVNVAHLMLTRAVRRRHEFAARLALGAGTGRIIRLVLMESFLIASVGGAVGLWLAGWGIGALMAQRPEVLPLAVRVGLNPAVVVFAICTTALTAVVFGLLPTAALIRGRAGMAYRGAGRTIGGVDQSRTRTLLVSTEVAASIVLVMTAGLLIRSFRNIHRVDPGFDPANVVTFDLTLRNPQRHDGPAARTQFVRELLVEIEALPGVHRASLVSRLPLDGRTWTNQVEYRGPLGPVTGESDFLMISEGYFDVMSTSVLAGRVFERGDDNQNVRVAVVDEVMARLLGGTQTALGQFIDFPLDGDRVRAEIIGIVEDIRYDDLRVEGRGAVYVPYRHEASRDVSVVVQTSGDMQTLLSRLPAVVAGLDPATPIHNLRAMSEVVGRSLSSGVFLLSVIGVFAIIALLLAVVGLYGVIAYAVGLREREIGIRIALGAQPARVAQGVVWQGLQPVAVGLVGGIALVMAGGRIVEQVLYGVDAVDLLTTLSAAGLVLVASAAACVLPARRASRIGPASVLRME